MRSLSRHNSIRVDEENPYWISFSDLMSALLVVFILAVVALIIELTVTQKKVEHDIEALRNAEKARHDILYEVKEELAKLDIVVEVADNDTVLRIPEKTLTFASDSDAIPNNKITRNAVEKIGFILHQKINKPLNDEDQEKMRFHYLDTVFIEGHTDSQRSKKNKGNWGLSTFRAISLWEYWDETLTVSPKFSEMENSDANKLFSVSGYAASRRLEINDNSWKKRAKNRRIDIRFTVRRPKLDDFENIKKLLEE